MLSKERENSKTILAIFRAIEERDPTQFRALVQPDFEIHWSGSLPYGGTFRGVEPQPRGWGATWQPLQPTEAERRMDPQVVAAHDDDVVVLWHQRGRSGDGASIDEESARAVSLPRRETRPSADVLFRYGAGIEFLGKSATLNVN